jgi:hypothetical protein
MPKEKVMAILTEFEDKATKDIELDRSINVDPYESVGKHKLIRLIRKRITRVFEKNNQEVS